MIQIFTFLIITEGFKCQIIVLFGIKCHVSGPVSVKKVNGTKRCSFDLFAVFFCVLGVLCLFGVSELL